ncbi:rhodanese-like domain-containing protein [Limosilactobacillus fermentum]|uniref:rhodanese-like domain-containing protein n=1 Tax=Limosilactobacillus fermentum TaxID=1613 RepID=UPI0021A8413A|nr:rhodanese-like domain-containing protein [Limosilactobacillus fermentum]
MVLAVSSGLMMLNIVILVLLIVWVGVWGLGAWRRRHYATVLSQEEFQAGLRRAQVIDLRPKDQFDRGHILGARSVPYALLRQQGVDLRADMPIYLYDEGMTVSTQAAVYLNKHGFKQLYILKDGYVRWGGKTKKAKYID